MWKICCSGRSSSKWLIKTSWVEITKRCRISAVNRIYEPIFTQKQQMNLAKRLQTAKLRGIRGTIIILASWLSSLSWDEFTRFISLQEADFSSTCAQTDKDMAKSFTDLEIKRIQLISVHFHLSRGLLIFHMIIFYYYWSGSCQEDTVRGVLVGVWRCSDKLSEPNVMIHPWKISPVLSTCNQTVSAI